VVLHVGRSRDWPSKSLGRRPADLLLDVMEREHRRAEAELPIEELQEHAASTPWPSPGKAVAAGVEGGEQRLDLRVEVGQYTLCRRQARRRPECA